MTYVASQIFHHPDGVMLPGESAELSDEAAERGLLLGVIAEEVPTEDVVPDDAETQE